MKLSPIARTFTRTIAERNLIAVKGKTRRRVRIQIGVPVQDVETAGGLDWRCPVRITGLSTRRMPAGIGVDSLQALVHALAVVEVHLSEAGMRRVELLWLGASGHGVPEIRLPTLKPRLETRLDRARRQSNPQLRSRRSRG